jgi:pilus assembly protein Flp/PilA
LAADKAENRRKERVVNGGSAMERLTKILRSTRGATAIEYGLIAALIAVAAVASFATLGNKLTNTFNNVNNNLV